MGFDKKKAGNNAPGNPFDMKQDVYDAYRQDFEEGYFSTGDVCNVRCVFCLAQWNPPGIIKSLGRFLTMEEIEHFSALYLKKADNIGSARYVYPGDFMLHPDVEKILKFLEGHHFLSHESRICTNVINLDEEKIKIVKRLNLPLSISLHALNSVFQKSIAGTSDKKDERVDERAVEALNFLNKYNVDYRVTIVAMNSTLRSGALENTVKYLKSCKARDIKIAKPGYTKYTPPDIVKELDLDLKVLFEFVRGLKKRYEMDIDMYWSRSDALMVDDIFYALTNFFKTDPELKRKKILFLCSKNVANIMRNVLKILKVKNCAVEAVYSETFGGNIECAGLLLVDDYLCAIKNFLLKTPEFKPDVIVVPKASFPANLQDLKMVSIHEIEKQYGIPVKCCTVKILNNPAC